MIILTLFFSNALHGLALPDITLELISALFRLGCVQCSAILVFVR